MYIIRVLFLLLLMQNTIVASTPLLLLEKKNYDTLPYYEYCDNNTTDIKRILEQKRWVAKKELLRTATYEPYWIHFKVKNQKKNYEELFFIGKRDYLFRCDYYLVKNNEVILHDSDDFFHRKKLVPFNSTHRLFPLNIDENEVVDIYLRVQNCNRLDIPFKVVNYQQLVEFFSFYHLFEGLLFATIIIMALYNLILYFIVHYKPYLYYVGYSIMLLLYQASYFGYFHLLTEWYAEWIYTTLIVSSIGFTILLVYFVQSLFEFKKNLPTFIPYFNLLLIILGGDLLFLLLSYSFMSHYYLELAFNIVNIVMPLYVGLVLFSLYYYFYITKNRLVLWYAVGWSLISIAGLLLILTQWGVLSKGLELEYVFEVAMTLETLLLSIFLAYRIKEIEEDKKEQQELLFHQSKQAMMGEMISYIAHQWRQPLNLLNINIIAFVLQYKKRILNEKLVEKFEEDSNIIIQHMSQTIDDFQNFLKPNKQKELFFLFDVLEDTFVFIRDSYKSNNIELKVERGKDIELLSYPNELIQVFLNILNNAKDAFIENGVKNRRVIIEIEDRGSNVAVVFKNNAGEVEPHILKLLTKPYFTTKKNGKGTGLGLYMCDMIVKNSFNGKIVIGNIQDGLEIQIIIAKKI